MPPDNHQRKNLKKVIFALTLVATVLALIYPPPAEARRRRGAGMAVSPGDIEHLTEYILWRIQNSALTIRGTATLSLGPSPGWFQPRPVNPISLVEPETIYFGSHVSRSFSREQFHFEIYMRHLLSDLEYAAEGHARAARAGLPNISDILNHMLMSFERRLEPCLTNDAYKKFVAWSFENFPYIPTRVTSLSGDIDEVFLLSRQDWEGLSIEVEEAKLGYERPVMNSLENNISCHMYGPSDSRSLESQLTFPGGRNETRTIIELDDRKQEWREIRGLFKHSLLVATHSIDPRLDRMSNDLLLKSHLDRSHSLNRREVIDGLAGYRARFNLSEDDLDMTWIYNRRRYIGQTKRICSRVRVPGTRRRYTYDCDNDARAVGRAEGLCFRAVRQELEYNFGTEAFTPYGREATVTALPFEPRRFSFTSEDEAEIPNANETSIPRVFLPDRRGRFGALAEAEFAGARLTAEGFINLLCVPEYAPFLKTAYSSPKNAIVVYRQGDSVFDPSMRGRGQDYGHIEQRVLKNAAEVLQLESAKNRVMRYFNTPQTSSDLDPPDPDRASDFEAAFNSIIRNHSTIFSGPVGRGLNSRARLQGFVSDYFCPVARNGNEFVGNGSSGRWSSEVGTSEPCVFGSPSTRKLHGIYVY